MIPVLGVPVLSGYDRLARMLASVDEPIGRIVVVDNGNLLGGIDGAHVIGLPTNIGVAASWNLIIRSTPAARWWCIVNHDIEFAPGDLAALTVAMDAGADLVTLDGFSAFGISAVCVGGVGLFDENFTPAYCEDADYEYRAHLLGVPIVSIPSGLRHERSSTIAEPHYRAQNERTYPANRAYYRAKWGGDLRGGETFRSPFDSGAHPSEWTLDPARLRELAWETTALAPVGYETR